MLYINGDGHSAGAGIVNGFRNAQEDPRYLSYGRRAHPDAVPSIYGYKVAKVLNQGLMLEAESGSSNTRILRTSRSRIAETVNKRDLFVIIGWSTWDRDEWKVGKDYLQISASGTDNVPEDRQEEYQKWLSNIDEEWYAKRAQYWHEEIWNFHLELKEQDIKHLFFHSTDSWGYAYENEDTLPEWEDSFIGAYGTDSFTNWLANSGFEDQDGYYSAEAHAAWYGFIFKKIRNGDRANRKQLTSNSKRSIITKNKVQPFTGLKK